LPPGKEEKKTRWGNAPLVGNRGEKGPKREKKGKNVEWDFIFGKRGKFPFPGEKTIPVWRQKKYRFPKRGKRLPRWGGEKEGHAPKSFPSQNCPRTIQRFGGEKRSPTGRGRPVLGEVNGAGSKKKGKGKRGPHFRGGGKGTTR